MITIITDEEIERSFRNTNFGNADKRKYLALSLLKTSAFYHSGYTITQIMIELKLVTPKNKKLTKKGGRFMYETLGIKESWARK